MTLLQTVPYEIRELNTDEWRVELRDLEDDPAGRPWPRTHDHNTDIALQGITYAPQFILLAPYTVTFENGLYAVNIVGTNNNVLERTNKNQVSVNPSNSAGLIIVETGTGITEQDKLDIANRVWVYATRSLTTFGTLIADIWAYVVRTLTSASGPTKEEIRIEMDDNSTELADIKERTDNLPDAPADVSDIPTATENADATWDKTLP